MSIEATNTGSTVDVTYGSMCGRIGYHFDFGDHVEYISLLDQRKAFMRILELMDAGKHVHLWNCTLTSIYKEIRACQQNLVDEAANLLTKLKQD